MRPVHYQISTTLPARPEVAFKWHSNPKLFYRLAPPWKSLQVETLAANLSNGTETVFRVPIAPFIGRKWVAEHSDYAPPFRFRDTQRKGPFAHWTHLHSFGDNSDGTCTLTDEIEFAPPLKMLTQPIFHRTLTRMIDSLFAYRHHTSVQDLQYASDWKDSKRLSIAVTGSSGVIGQRFCNFAETLGHQITRIHRDAGSSEGVYWEPSRGQIDAEKLEGFDAIVHLAGENIAGKRWSTKQKRRIRDSRVSSTQLLVETVARLASPPSVFVSASAIGIYGDRGDETLDDEASYSNETFLSRTAQEWEQASDLLRDSNVRLVKTRFGIVLSPQGGALKELLRPFKCCLGGKVGKGRQFWSWVTIDDVVQSLMFCLQNNAISGPVNVVSPNTCTNLDFVKALGAVLRRPTVLPLPGVVARAVLGEMAEELLLHSTRVVPSKLLEHGYQFRDPVLTDALSILLGCSGKNHD